MQKRTEKELSHMVERMRLNGSKDSAYQHLLDTLAADIERRCMQPGVEAATKRISNFVRNWRP